MDLISNNRLEIEQGFGLAVHFRVEMSNFTNIVLVQSLGNNKIQ